MVWGSLLFGRSRAARERSLRGIVAAVNTSDYSKIASFAAGDLEFVDFTGAKVVGRESFALNSQRFSDATGNPQIRIQTLDHNGEEVLMRGTLEGGTPTVNGPTMWRVQYRSGKVSLVEVTRPDAQLSMPSFAKRFSEKRD